MTYRSWHTSDKQIAYRQMLWTIFEQPLPRVILTVFGTAVTQTSNAGQPSVVKSSQDVNLPFKRNTKESCNASRPWDWPSSISPRCNPFCNQTCSAACSRQITNHQLHNFPCYCQTTCPPTADVPLLERFLQSDPDKKKKKKMIVRPFR